MARGRQGQPGSRGAPPPACRCSPCRFPFSEGMHLPTSESGPGAAMPPGQGRTHLRLSSAPPMMTRLFSARSFSRKSSMASVLHWREFWPITKRTGVFMSRRGSSTSWRVQHIRRGLLSFHPGEAFCGREGRNIPYIFTSQMSLQATNLQGIS